MYTNPYFLISNSPCLSPPLAPPAPPGLSATPHSLPLLYPRSNMQQLLHSRNACRRRSNRLLTFSSCVLILLVSSWAFPAPPSPPSASSSSSSSSLSWTNLWKLKKKTRWMCTISFREKNIPWHVQEVGGLPFLQCFLLLNVAGRGSSLEETGHINEIAATEGGDNATWKLELPPSSWQPPHRHCHPLRICCKTNRL